MSQSFSTVPSYLKDYAAGSSGIGFHPTFGKIHRQDADATVTRNGKRLRSISPVAAFPQLRSHFSSRRGPTEPPPVRAKYPKGSTTERVLALAESQLAI